MSTKFWQGVAVYLQSAIGAAQTITGITKASPGVVTTSGTLPTNGQYVLITAAGMSQVNNRIFKVSGASGSTFNIGTDTTLFSTFASGSFQVVTYGFAFTALRDPQSSGGDPVTEDTTTIQDSQDTDAIISSTALGYSFNADWDTADTALLAANAAAVAQSPRACRIVFADAQEYAFYASWNVPMSPQVSGRKVTTPISCKLKNAGTPI